MADRKCSPIKRMTHPVLAFVLKRPPPYEYMASSSSTSDSEEQEQHNTWYKLLELLTLPGSSAAGTWRSTRVR